MHVIKHPVEGVQVAVSYALDYKLVGNLRLI